MGAPEGEFCPKCGSAVGATDIFCRRCGASLQEADPIAAADEGDATPRRRGLRRLRDTKVLVAVVAFVALLGAGAAVAAFTLVGQSDEPTAAESAQAEVEAHRARLLTPFQEAMQMRARFFSAERQYIDAMADARRSIRNYQRRQAQVRRETLEIQRANEAQFELCRAYVEVECPDPTYPDSPQVPDLDGSVEKLRAAARRLDQIKADLVTFERPDELGVFSAQLLASVEALNEDATHNADVLVEAVSSSFEGGEFLDSTKLKTLRAETALPSIRQMNRAAVQVIRLLGLKLTDYDVPGGRDAEPGDHSNVGPSGAGVT